MEVYDLSSCVLWNVWETTFRSFLNLTLNADWKLSWRGGSEWAREWMSMCSWPRGLKLLYILINPQELLLLLWYAWDMFLRVVYQLWVLTFCLSNLMCPYSFKEHDLCHRATCVSDKVINFGTCLFCYNYHPGNSIGTSPIILLTVAIENFIIGRTAVQTRLWAGCVHGRITTEGVLENRGNEIISLFTPVFLLRPEHQEGSYKPRFDLPSKLFSFSINQRW